MFHGLLLRHLHFSMHPLLQSLISFSAALHLFDLESERSLTEPNHWESSVWETFSELNFFFCCWMISWFLLSDHLYTYSLFYTAFFNHPGVFITQSWLLMWVMYGNMQSKTKQIYVLVHIMALNEFQNSFGYMIINRLLPLCKLLGSESWRCDLGVENAVTSFFLNGFWYGSTSYTLWP